MRELEQRVQIIIQSAKHGDWDFVLNQWQIYPSLIARRSSRYVDSDSKWTILHYAASDGNERICRDLIRLGASLLARTNNNETPEDIARNNSHSSLADLLKEAAQPLRTLAKCTPLDADLYPSSPGHSTVTKQYAEEGFFVCYLGHAVHIPSGEAYYTDSFDRAIIGWHGSYSPPLDMDGKPLVSLSVTELDEEVTNPQNKVSDRFLSKENISTLILMLFVALLVYHILN